LVIFCIIESRSAPSCFASRVAEFAKEVGVGTDVAVGSGVRVGDIGVGGIGVGEGISVAAGLQATNAMINASVNSWVNFKRWHIGLLS
jgi:hypothetical protein